MKLIGSPECMGNLKAIDPHCSIRISNGELEYVSDRDGLTPRLKFHDKAIVSFHSLAAPPVKHPLNLLNWRLTQPHRRKLAYMQEIR